MIALVCPLHRSADVENVRENWLRLGGLLIVVENGEGIGACEAAGFEPCVTLRESGTLSEIRNAGVEAAWSLGADAWAALDADDYYAAGYLRRLERAFARGADVIAQSSAYIRASNGDLILLSGRTTPHFGGTIASRRRDLYYPDPPESAPWTDDTEFLRQSVRPDVTTYAAPAGLYIYRRDRGAHYSPATDAQLIACYRAGVIPERDRVVNYGHLLDAACRGMLPGGEGIPRPSTQEIAALCTPSLAQSSP